jgi:hypothetical protein
MGREISRPALKWYRFDSGRRPFPSAKACSSSTKRFSHFAQITHQPSKPLNLIGFGLRLPAPPVLMRVQLLSYPTKIFCNSSFVPQFSLSPIRRLFAEARLSALPTQASAPFLQHSRRTSGSCRSISFQHDPSRILSCKDISARTTLCLPGDEMQVEQQHAIVDPVPESFRHLLNVLDSWRTAMKRYLARETSSEASEERTAGYRSYFMIDASNPHQPGSFSYQEWEKGYDQADRCYTW